MLADIIPRSKPVSISIYPPYLASPLLNETIMRKLLCTCIAIFLVKLLSFSQTWEPTPAPPDFLTDHTFGFGIDGKGYLVAGTTDSLGPTNAFWQFDPGTDSWTALDSFPGAARGYGIGDILDGKAYFGFGVSATEMLNDLWVFDPDSSRWSDRR